MKKVEDNTMGTLSVNDAPIMSLAKVSDEKQITKVYQFFKYTIGTTLDCSISTHILRNNITWYVSILESMGMIGVVYVARDQRTHRIAKHYSCDPSKWLKSKDNRQLKIWEV